MINKIDRQSITTSGTIKGVVANQDMNGLIIVMNAFPGATDYCSVMLKSSKHPQEVLVNRVPLVCLSEISDFNWGMSDALQADQVLQAGSGVKAVAMYAFNVDLGYLSNVANDSIVEVLVEVGQTAIVGVYTYLNKLKSDFYYKIMLSQVLSNGFKNADQIFVYNTATFTAATLYTLNVNAMVKAKGNATFCDLAGIVAATYTLGEVEASGPKNTYIIYQNKEDFPGPVDVVISGSDTGTCSLVSIEKCVDLGRVQRGSMKAITDRMAGMQALPEAQQKAVVLGGQSISADKLAVTSQTLANSYKAGQ